MLRITNAKRWWKPSEKELFSVEIFVDFHNYRFLAFLFSNKFMHNFPPGFYCGFVCCVFFWLLLFCFQLLIKVIKFFFIFLHFQQFTPVGGTREASGNAGGNIRMHIRHSQAAIIGFFCVVLEKWGAGNQTRPDQKRRNETTKYGG